MSSFRKSTIRSLAYSDSGRLWIQEPLLVALRREEHPRLRSDQRGERNVHAAVQIHLGCLFHHLRLEGVCEGGGVFFQATNRPTTFPSYACKLSQIFCQIHSLQALSGISRNDVKFPSSFRRRKMERCWWNTNEVFENIRKIIMHWKCVPWYEQVQILWLEQCKSV